eukprot:TRINITY_DN11136_c0_g1_i1.p1 TRINITY_DN11136_c0_g1~~TRINITY_DN11136_c0_g1_i1.p1  ORF type:complete len:349 (+),score=59.95 TRINITY_DN11136_c0_g1_i1:109-1047(+)
MARDSVAIGAAPAAATVALRRMSRLSCHVVASQAGTAGASGEAEGPPVLYELRGPIAVLTLNRAANRNAMTEEMLVGVRDVARRAAADPDIRCVVVVGRGRNFCGGADMRDTLGRTGADVPEVAPGTLWGSEKLMAMYSPFLELLNIKVPVIAAMQGHAIGGGLGLALCCDIRIAHAGSQYGSNFVRLGLHPGMATTYLLPRLVGVPRAAELLLTGRLVTGSEAARVGLCTEVADDPDAVLAAAMRTAEAIAVNAPIAVRWTKRSLYQHLQWDPRGAAWDEAQLQSQTAQTADFQEGKKALIEKRPPRFSGC